MRRFGFDGDTQGWIATDRLDDEAAWSLWMGKIPMLSSNNSAYRRSRLSENSSETHAPDTNALIAGSPRQ